MKAKYILGIFLTCIVLTLTSCSKSSASAADRNVDTDRPKTEFMVVGYMFSSGNLDVESAKLDLRKITHLNIAFINPLPDGSFASVVGLAAAVKRAHENKVKVLFSFGGGNPPAHLKDLIKPNRRASFVAEIGKLINTFKLDGVDVDLEGDFIDANYESLIVELSALLKPQNKLITAAVATWNGNNITDKALALFDYVHIMSYDQTGPWRKEQPGPHSTYEAAVADLNYWGVTRGIAAAKLTLGLPFYGYGFGPDILESYSYGDIIIAFPDADMKDEIVLPNKGTIYYNGSPTIKKKMDLALQRKIAGVMIWQLFGDATGDKSLLSAINAAIK